MFEEKENDVIEQSNLFPKFIDKGFVKSYGLFGESIAHLRALLEGNFMLRDYTIAYNYVLLKADKSILKEVGNQILTHELEDKDNFEGWITFRYYYDDKDNLQYETSENIIGYGLFQPEINDEDHEDYYNELDENDSLEDDFDQF